MATSRSEQTKDLYERMSRPTELRPAAGEDLIAQYGCGPVQFSGTSDALYERHLLFDSVRDLTSAGGRERFEACARSVR